MRILMLSQFYPPVVGGEERHVQVLSQALVARRHDVTVTTIANDGVAREEIDQGVRVKRIRTTVQRLDSLYSDPERRHAPPFPDPEATRSLLQIVRDEQPDIIHAHNWLLYSFLPLKRWSKGRLVVTLHDYSLVCAQKRLMREGRRCSGPSPGGCLRCTAHHYGLLKGPLTLLGNRIMSSVEKRLVDLFLPVSLAVARGNGLVAEELPFQVIPNFLPDTFDQGARDLSAYTDQLPQEAFLLFVGDLVTDKGIEVLLEAYAGLKEAPPLVLIGRISKEIAPLLPAQVVAPGRWPHGAVLEAWKRSLLGLVPSVCEEAFGVVAIEAMSYGRPVIASRVGGLAGIVEDGVSGLLVPPGNAAALRTAIEQLLADEKLRETMGAAARERAKQYRASAIVPRIEEIYEALLASDPELAVTAYQLSSTEQG